MKHFYLYIVVLISVLFPSGSSAQSLLNSTYYNPVSFESRTENVSVQLGGGCSFRGRKVTSYVNGQVSNISYYGTGFMPDGGKLVTLSVGTGFDANFQFPNGRIFEVEPDGSACIVDFKNGREVNRQPLNQSYHFDNYCIVLETTPSVSPVYPVAPVVPTVNTCGVCSGTGKCSFCGGSGISNKHAPGIIVKCGGCDGSGKCATCSGRGYH